MQLRIYTTNDIHLDCKTVVFFFPIPAKGAKRRKRNSRVRSAQASHAVHHSRPRRFYSSSRPFVLNTASVARVRENGTLLKSTVIMKTLQRVASILSLVAFKQLPIYYFTEDIAKRVH